MKVLYWPQLDERKTPEVSLEDFHSKLKRKRPDLWAMVRETIKQAEKPGGIEALRKSQWVSRLSGSDPIWEFRIPPTKRGGEVRIYFCSNWEMTIVLYVSTKN